MTVYVLNTLIVPVDFDTHPQVTVKLKRVSLEEARQLVERALTGGELVSAIGHQGTAQVLSQLFGIEIPFNRITVYFQPGDEGLHFFLKTRLPEGKVLTAEELKTLDFWLVHSQVL